MILKTLKTLKPTTIFSSCCSALLVFAACGTPIVGSRFVKSEAVSASQGKTIAVSEKDSAVLAGTSLAVPAGALAQDTVITLEVGLDTLLDADEAAGPVTTWGPAGTRFSTPAIMTVPLTVNQSGDELTILVQEADGTRFELPASAVTVDAQGRARFAVNGFTSFQPQRRRPCTANAQCRSGEVCRAGRCRPAATQCQADTDCAQGQACTSGVCQSATVCPADAFQCSNGSFVSRTGPNCTFPACPATDGGSTTCPRDAQLCADGSSVSRTGPNCTFPACPATDGGSWVCPADALRCSDGSFVSRTGPNCTFPACPATDGGGSVCPADARQCADGSFVSRTGPNCTFPACPATDGGSSVCPADARQCADGSFVSRTGPNCTFPACPGVDGGLACASNAQCANGQSCVNRVCR